MKKILLFLLIIPVLSFGQTFNSATLSFRTTTPFGDSVLFAISGVTGSHFFYDAAYLNAHFSRGGGSSPTGSAGGDLAGTYPNPTINTINSISKSFYDPTSSIQTQLNGKQAALGFTPENVANKTATASTSTTTYPNWVGVENYVVAQATTYVAKNNYSTGYLAFGDSITAFTGPPSPSLAWSAILQKIVGGNYYNYGNPGDQIADLTYRWLFANYSPKGDGTDPLVTVAAGTNDGQYYTTTNQQTIFKRAYLAAIVWPSIPLADKVYAQTMTAVNFAADNGVANGLAETSSTNGATLTTSISTNASSYIYFFYKITDGNTGTVTFKIDGTLQPDNYTASTTINGFGDGSATIATHNGTTNAIVCQTFAVSAAGTHAIVITNTGTTGQALTVYAIATNPATNANNPTVIVPDILHRNDSFETSATAFNGFETTLVTQEQGKNLNIITAPVRAALGTNYSANLADAIHPNATGSALYGSTVIGVTPAKFQNGGSVSNPYAPSEDLIFNNAPNPSQWFSPNGLAITSSTTGLNPGILYGRFNGNLFYSYANPTTGITFVGPNTGTPIFSIGANTGLGGISANQALGLSHYMDVLGSGQINFFTGSGGVANTATFQNNYANLGPLGNYRGSGTNSLTQPNNYVLATTSATSSANVNSPFFGWSAYGWTGSASFPSDLGFINKLNTGSNPASYLSLAFNNGFSGGFALDLTAATLQNRLGFATLSASTTTFPSLSIPSSASFPTSPVSGYLSNIGGILKEYDGANINRIVATTDGTYTAGAVPIYNNSGNRFVAAVITGSNGVIVTPGSGTISITGNPSGLIVGTPTVVAGTGAGTSPTVSVTSNGRSLTLTVTTGTLPTGTGATVATITLATALSYTPTPTFSSGNNNSALLSGATMVYMNSTGTANVTITSGTTGLTAATTYIWNISL